MSYNIIMKVKSLELNNFRNYDNLSISFEDGLNVVVGKNAQGKTNMLESIFLCAIGKSPRTSKEKEMIKWEKNKAKVELLVETKKGNKKIEFYIFDNTKKAIKINGFSLKKMGELMGELTCVYFSPDELKLVKDSPEERRKFMDISLSQFDKNYFYNLSKYNKVLMQRNKLLKDTKDKEVLLQTLPIWNEELALTGAKIIFDRLKFIRTLSKFSKEIHKDITSEKEDLSLSYLGISGDSEKEIKEKLLIELEKNAERDIALGFTSVGPHRDDIKIMSNFIDVRTYGSQGQQRTVALSLKLAELEFFNFAFGEYPVLLLDDVLSELDLTRQEKLLKHVENIQCIITGIAFPFSMQTNLLTCVSGEISKTNFGEKNE